MVLKSPTIAKLKKKLWKIFSEYIRLRSADWRGYATCVTCGVVKNYKELQAGHFIPGRHNAILFDPRNCHPQCYRCNIPLKSNPRKYDAYMRANYGADVIEELEKQNDEMKQFTGPELQEKIVLYINLLKSL